MKNALISKKTLFGWSFAICLSLFTLLAFVSSHFASASLPEDKVADNQNTPVFAEQTKENSDNNTLEKHVTFNLDSNNAENKNTPQNRCAHRRANSFFSADQF